MSAANYYRLDGWVKAVLGPAIAGAQVYVCTQPADYAFLPPLPLASIYSDAGYTPVTQPIATDGFGHYDFYALPGLYTIVVVSSGKVQQVYLDQSVGNVGTGGGGGGASRISGISYVIDGGGSVISTGLYGQINIPASCTVTGWVLTADQSGYAEVDVLRSTFSAFPSTSSITGTDIPLLSNAQKNENLAISAWGSTALNAGDQLQFNVVSASVVKRLNITLNVTVP